MARPYSLEVSFVSFKCCVGFGGNVREFLPRVRSATQFIQRSSAQGRYHQSPSLAFATMRVLVAFWCAIAVVTAFIKQPFVRQRGLRVPSGVVPRVRPRSLRCQSILNSGPSLNEELQTMYTLPECPVELKEVVSLIRNWAYQRCSTGTAIQAKVIINTHSRHLY